MKCRFVLDVDADIEAIDEREKLLLDWKVDAAGRRVWFFPKDCIRDHWNAAFYVKNGMAVPADDECAKAAGVSDEQMKVLQHKYARTLAGIHPDDFDLYDAGVMVGYNGDGTMKPGLNWEKYHKAKDEALVAENKDEI